MTAGTWPRWPRGKRSGYSGAPLKADRTRPLLAYTVVSLACAAVVAQGLDASGIHVLPGGAPEASPGPVFTTLRGTALTARPSAGPLVPGVVTRAGSKTGSQPAGGGSQTAVGASPSNGSSAGTAVPVVSEHAATSPVTPVTAAATKTSASAKPSKGKANGHGKGQDVRPTAAKTASPTTDDGQGNGKGKGKG